MYLNSKRLFHLLIIYSFKVRLPAPIYQGNSPIIVRLCVETFDMARFRNLNKHFYSLTKKNFRSNSQIWMSIKERSESDFTFNLG